MRAREGWETLKQRDVEGKEKSREMEWGEMQSERAKVRDQVPLFKLGFESIQLDPWRKKKNTASKGHMREKR